MNNLELYKKIEDNISSSIQSNKATVTTYTRKKDNIYMTANKNKSGAYTIKVNIEKLKEQEIINRIKKRLGG